MNTKIQILSPLNGESDGLPNNSHIIVDTSFLIDAYRNLKIFEEIFIAFNQSRFQLVTIDAVLYEFMCGSKSIEEYNRRLRYFNTIVDTTLPVDPHVISHCLNISKLLLTRGSHLSYADGLQIATLMRYSRMHTYLLSKDRGDIPITIFPIALTYIVETGINNFAFSMYAYNKESYTQGLVQLSK